MEAQRNAEAPDPLLFLVAGMFGLVFLARLVFVAIRYWRAFRP
jgi:hypothetical protein